MRFDAALARRVRAHTVRGGLLAYATASCFGLGCHPRSARAVRALLRLKVRPKHKGLIVIADRASRLKPYAARLPEGDWRRAQQKWPGPHTWLMPASNKALRLVRGRSDKVALRVDAHPDVVRLCRSLRHALISTSLNRAGRKPIKTYREARRQFGKRVLVVPGRIGRARSPSTIQDFATGRILRR